MKLWTDMLIRIGEHENYHHGVVGRPPYDESGHDHQRYPERFHLGFVDQFSPVEVDSLPGAGRLLFLEHFIAL